MEPLVFISCAGEDAAYARELETQLGPLLQSGAYRVWHRGLAEPGADVEATARARLGAAQVIVILASAPGLQERRGDLEIAADLHHRGRARMIPVRLRMCMWEGTPLAGLEALPRGGGALNTAPDRDAAWLQVVEAVTRAAPFGEQPGALREHRFTDEVERVCRLREPAADFRREPAVRPFDGLLVEAQRRGPVVRIAPIGVLDDDVSEADLDVFCTRLEAPFRRRHPTLRSRIVHAGRAAPDDLLLLADGRGVDLVSFGELQGLLDFSKFRAWQRGRLLGDPAYPPALYVPQRLVFSGASRETPEGSALEVFARRVTESGPCFWVVLGEFGVGKTFLMRKLALRFSEDDSPLTPVLLEMRSLEKARTLDALLGQHMISRHGMHRFEDEAFRYMLAEGQILLLFDGFDELALRVSYERAADHLDTILSAATGRAKVILTSRTQHFWSEHQLRTALGDRALAAGFRLVRIERFDHGQIQQFLINKLGDEAKAEARIRLIDDVKDLLGLSANPRMLGFIAELEEAHLRAARSRSGEITSADLYRLLVEKWLVHEYDRAHPPGTELGLSVSQRWEAITRLALLLWPRLERTIAVSELPPDVVVAVNALSRRPIESSVVAHQIGSGTVLCRGEDDAFSFMHQSILEWLVAREAAREALASRTTSLFAASEMSDLMADFFVAMAGKEVAVAWARAALADRPDDLTVKNAQRVLRRAGVRAAANMAGHHLDGHDFSGQDLREVDLSGAHLAGALFAGASLEGARLAGATLVGARLVRADLRGADLSGANLSFSSLLGADLRGATLAGARLRYARLVGAAVDARALESLDTFGATPTGAVAPRPVTFAAASYSSVAVSPDGALLASGDLDGRVILWDMTSRRALRVINGQAGAIRAVAFSPDGRTLGAASDNTTVRLWDAGTGELRLELRGHTLSVLCIAFSPDGDCLATGSDDGAVRIWDARTGGLRSVLHEHHRSVWSVAFSRTGALASGCSDGTIRVWNAPAGEPRATFSGHTQRVSSVAFSPDGATLASGSDDGTVRLWDAVLGEPRATLEGHFQAVLGVAFSPDGAWIASASLDMTVGLWDARTGGLRATLRGHQHRVWSVAFSPDGAQVVSASSDATLRLWDAGSGEARATLEGRMTRLWSVAFSPDGACLASGSSDTTIRLWDARSSQLRATLRGHQQRVASVAFSPDGACLASGSSDTTIRLWSALSQEMIATLKGHSGSVLSVAFSPGGALLASGSSDTCIHLWSVESSRVLSTLEGHSRGILAVTFSPDGELLASGSEDNTVRLWNPRSGELLATLRGHQRGVLSVAFSPDGDTLVTGSGDHTVRLWSPRSGSLRSLLAGHGTSVPCVAFSPGGDVVASGSGDATIRLWDPHTGKHRATLEGHSQGITSITFSPDGRHLASASEDDTIRLWDVATARCLAVLYATPSGWVAFRPDGSYKLSGDLQGGFWHVLGLCRFEPGELDEVYSGLRLAESDALY